jgi:transcriptional regulator GlxA family with amidase domain
MKRMHRRIVFVVFDGFQLLDLAGPADVFAAATLLARPGGYRIEVAAAEAGPVTANTGITIEAGTALADVTGEVDTLIVAGGLSVRRHLPDQTLTGHLGRLSTLARRTASVCSGALLETTDHPLDRIARETGIGAPETLFRVFRRLWRVAPGEYRRRFATTQA